MFNLVSIGIGLIALPFALLSFLPFLGWGNWFVVPLAVIGAAVGALSRSTAGRNLNLVVIVVGILRLTLGHGIL